VLVRLVRVVAAALVSSDGAGAVLRGTVVVVFGHARDAVGEGVESFADHGRCSPSVMPAASTTSTTAAYMFTVLTL
jgi:hypothetical protein